MPVRFSSLVCENKCCIFTTDMLDISIEANRLIIYIFFIDKFIKLNNINIIAEKNLPSLIYASFVA